jgi:hypothetical protein
LIHVNARADSEQLIIRVGSLGFAMMTGFSCLRRAGVILLPIFDLFRESARRPCLTGARIGG